MVAGLSITRKNIEADGGTLTIRDVLGPGCIFTMSCRAIYWADHSHGKQLNFIYILINKQL